MKFLAPEEFVDLNPSTTGSFVDIDVSAYVAEGATAAVIAVDNLQYNTHTKYAFRKNGSTDDIYYDIMSNNVSTVIVALDEDGIFEMKKEFHSILQKLYIIGYFESGDGYVPFTNYIDKSLGSLDTYIDIDISANTGDDTAIMAVVAVVNTASVAAYFYDVRKNGSSDTYYVYARAFNNRSFFVSLDENEIFEGKIANATLKFYIAGYFTSGVTGYTNLTEINPALTGVWEDYTIGGSDVVEIFQTTAGLGLLRCAIVGDNVGIVFRGDDGGSGTVGVIGVRPDGTAYDWRTGSFAAAVLFMGTGSLGPAIVLPIISSGIIHDATQRIIRG
uniref:Uncharacterized protein n=1 Tax=viral metagenome TaxID=1070528 RepID=A0A6M3K6K8_9ZZZZ